MPAAQRPGCGQGSLFPALSSRLGPHVASILAGSWRLRPFPADLSKSELERVASLLLQSGAGALAWNRIRASPALAESAPGRELRDAYRVYALQAALLEHELERVLARLREARIEPLLVKGLAAARLYAERGLRPYGDFDLLVRPEEYERARETLEGVGAQVDLHAEAGTPANIRVERSSTEELLSRSEVVPLDGHEVRVAGAEDHLRLVCLHFLAHGGWRPLWLCDVAAALEARAEGFDWDLCLRGGRRLATAVACTVGLAGELLGAELGDAPATTPPRWLHDAVLRQWGVPASIFPRLVQGRPLRTYLRRPEGALAALRARWPNPVESTVYLRAPFNALPRLPYQVAYLVARVGYRRWREPLHS